MSKMKIEKIEQESVNTNITLTRSIFLRSMGFVYLIAYLSLFYQIQGLWGDEGLLPAKNLLEKINENYKDKSGYIFPVILWFSETINFSFNLLLKNLKSMKEDTNKKGSILPTSIFQVTLEPSESYRAHANVGIKGEYVEKNKKLVFHQDILL